MAMPSDLVLVRHGESEGNVYDRRSRAGGDQTTSTQFESRHTSLWRLSDRGRLQAEATGAWLREAFPSGFHRHYTSEYLRAKETASLLSLPGAHWYLESYLREREWDGDRSTDCSWLKAREQGQTFWFIPPNGESIAQLCLRIDRFLDTLHRECAGQRVVVVCHGEVMWAFRVRLERLTSQTYAALDRSENPHDRIHNGQILHYTRINPTSGETEPYLGWKRSVWPWSLSLSSNEWQAIVREKFSNADLLAEAERIPRIID